MALESSDSLNKKVIEVNLLSLDPDLKVPPPPVLEYGIIGDQSDPEPKKEDETDQLLNDYFKDKGIETDPVKEYYKKNWEMWCRISIASFGFKNKFEMKYRVRVFDGDILYHKLKLESEFYPQVHYFIIENGIPMKRDNKDVKGWMGTNLIEYVQIHHKLPYACKIEEYFKKGSVKISYTPSKWDQFMLNISEKKAKKYNIESFMDFFNDMKPELENPIKPVIVTKNKIRR